MATKKVQESIARIEHMEAILDEASERLAALENCLAEFEEIQDKISELEAYYTGSKWREDLELDEAGKLPDDLKRGVLSEDGICDLLERNRELKDRIDK